MERKNIKTFWTKKKKKKKKKPYLELHVCIQTNIFSFLHNRLIVFEFNDMSSPIGRDSRGDEREGQGRKRKMNESEETEETRNVSV